VISRMYDGLRQQVRELITPLAKAGEAEVFRSLAVPFPAHVFLALFGLPLEDRDRLIEWKDRIIKSTDPKGLEGGDAAAGMELMGYLVEQIKQRRSDLSGDDVLTAVLKDGSKDAMNDEEILGLCLLLVNAGLDTVTHSLMFMFLTLAQRPDLQAQLAADFDLIPNFVEEVVRLNPVAPFPPRVVTRDTEIEGCPVSAGSHVTVCLGAANRDPRQHENPDEIDLARTSRHWGFGGGPHRCLGSHLARAEMRLVLEEWLKLVPSFSLKDGVEPQMPWPVPLLNLEKLTLVFDPAKG
jgi:cytochrome P450